VLSDDSNPADLPPPFGKEMPPRLIELHFDPDRGKSRCELPFYYNGYVHSDAHGNNRAMITFRTHDYKLQFDPKADLVLTRNQWTSGEVFPICGQIYRFSLNHKAKKAAFERIDRHRLALRPEQAIGVLHLGFDGEVSLVDQSRRVQGTLSVVTETEKETDRDETQVQVKVESLSPLDRSVSVRSVSVGDRLDAGVWSFKVQRIVVPKKDEQIVGWIDLCYLAPK
jgi:hypothetical protein